MNVNISAVKIKYHKIRYPELLMKNLIIFKKWVKANRLLHSLENFTAFIQISLYQMKEKIGKWESKL